jgi:hypothetical protein
MAVAVAAAINLEAVQPHLLQAVAVVAVTIRQELIVILILVATAEIMCQEVEAEVEEPLAVQPVVLVALVLRPQIIMVAVVVAVMVLILMVNYADQAVQAGSVYP